MENFRKNLRLGTKELKFISFYEEMHNLAKVVTKEMQSSSVILDIRKRYLIKGFNAS
jgi:hypothetical protein